MKTPWNLKILYISSFLLRFSFAALLIVIAKYIPGETNYDLLRNVAIVAVPYPFAEMLTANYFGIKSDKIGRKRIIVMGTALAASVTLLYSLWDNVWYLATMHGIHGIGAAATIAPAIAMIADHAHSSDRGRQMGWFDYSTLLGYVFGGSLGAFSIAYLGNRTTFIIIAGILFLSAFLLQRLVRTERPKQGAVPYGNWRELRKVFRRRDVRRVFPIWLLIAILLGLAITYLPRIMFSEGFSEITVGLLIGAAGAALGLLQPFWGKVSDKVGRIPVMTYGVASITGIVVVLIFFLDATIVRTDNGWEVGIGIIPLVICGIGAGAFIPSALGLMADCSDEECYGATMGLYSFALGFGAFIAESIGLAIIVTSGDDRAPLWLLYFAAALIFLALLLMILFFARGSLDRLKKVMVR